MKIDPLIDTIKRSIVTGTAKPVRIIDRTLLLDIIEDDSKCKPKYKSLKDLKGRERLKAVLTNIKTFLKYISTSAYFNFIVIVTVLVIAALSLIVMFSFFLNQIVLHNPDQYVNDRGTLVFNQPLATEHYMFLLNSSDLWADSGIEVIKGDRVKITVSGSFYSDVEELYRAACDNDTLKYSYFHKLDASGAFDKNALHPNVPFGALLYRIEAPAGAKLPVDSIPFIEETRDDDTHEITFIAPKSGILHFTVNDIYLTPKVVNNLYKENIPNDSIMTKTKMNDYLSNLEEYGDKMGRKWFDDNCGEMLINVKITRDITKKNDIPFYDKIFIYLMRLFD